MTNNALIYPGAVQELRFIIEKLGAKKVFLVTGNKSYLLSGAKEKIEEEISDLQITQFSDFRVNPNLNDLKSGVDLFNQQKCDVIVAVGGGSVIDMAKLINYYHNSQLTVIDEDHLENKAFSPLPFISIPTTAGSGSEATHFAVMYIDGVKVSVADSQLLPSHVIVDPELHYSQTPYQKAVSGIDAFAQAVESMWNVHSTEESRMLSEKAIDLIWHNMEKVVHDNDKYAHWAVALGANLAGRAINITKTTAPHALSYGFTNAMGLPHGHSVALSLPFFMKYHQEITVENCNDKRGVDHVKQVLARVSAILNVDYESLSKEVARFFKQLGVKINFKELDISREKFDCVTKEVNHERLGNNPAKMDNDVLSSLFEFNSSI